MTFAAATIRPNQCWCGITQVTSPCIFHGGDLEQRVAAVIDSISLIDTEDGSQLKASAKWLAFVIGMSSARGQIRRGQLHLFGDVILDFAPDREFPVNYMSREEQAALTGEVLCGRWPF